MGAKWTNLPEVIPVMVLTMFSDRKAYSLQPAFLVMSIEIHGKILLGRLLLSIHQIGLHRALREFTLNQPNVCLKSKNKQFLVSHGSYE